MNSIKSFVFAAFAAALCAQDKPKDQAPAAQDPAITARLTPVREIVTALGEIELMLSVEVKRETRLDATVISGLDLTTKINDKNGPPVAKKETGQVKVAGGTRLERRLKFSAPDVAESAGKMSVITFAWPDLPGATTTVRVAPDPNKIDLAQLDYEKTQVILVTNFGDMTVGFRPDKAPNHVKNFVKLSKEGFYNGTKFHRVIKGFMLQGGCPNTKEGASGMPGTGSSGTNLQAEFNDIRHQRGVLSMARSNDPNSASCQFFVMHGENTGLNGAYTAFGQLVSGHETLDKIANVRVKASPGGEMSAPIDPVHLYSAIVIPAYKQ